MPKYAFVPQFDKNYVLYSDFNYSFYDQVKKKIEDEIRTNMVMEGKDYSSFSVELGYDLKTIEVKIGVESEKSKTTGRTNVSIDEMERQEGISETLIPELDMELTHTKETIEKSIGNVMNNIGQILRDAQKEMMSRRGA